MIEKKLHNLFKIYLGGYSMGMDDLLESKYKYIGEKAKRDKGEIKYLIKFIKKNYNSLYSEFEEEIKKSFKENIKHLIKNIEEKGYKKVKHKFFDEELYKYTGEEINELEEILIGARGLVGYEEKYKFPRINLGWTKYSKQENHPTFVQIITKEGKRISDDYRKARGLEPLTEKK